MNNLKILSLVSAVVVLTSACQSPPRPDHLEFEASAKHPFGQPNPEAPQELQQFAFMIGQNDCVEERHNPADGQWVRSTRTWDAWYTMNGNAIYDSGRSGSRTNGNMRIFDQQTGQWHVTFFSSPQYSTGTWVGGKEGSDMVLKRPQKAPGSGIDGESVLTFSDISDSGFSWLGQWQSADGTIVFPFWKMTCSKR